MEIEARVKVENLEDLKQKLLGMGAELGGSEEQYDAIYKQKGREMELQRAGSFILRIRKVSGKDAILTFKALTEVTGSWKEHETTIGDAEEMHKMLKEIGYVVSLQVSKKREHLKLRDINICLDDVKEMGTHIELEVISENSDEGRRKLVELLDK